MCFHFHYRGLFEQAREEQKMRDFVVEYECSGKLFMNVLVFFFQLKERWGVLNWTWTLPREVRHPTSMVDQEYVLVWNSGEEGLLCTRNVIYIMAGFILRLTDLREKALMAWVQTRLWTHMWSKIIFRRQKEYLYTVDEAELAPKEYWKVLKWPVPGIVRLSWILGSIIYCIICLKTLTALEIWKHWIDSRFRELTCPWLVHAKAYFYNEHTRC